MSADTEPTTPLDAAELRKKAIQLRAFIDQGEFRAGDEEHEQLLAQIFTDDELDAIEEHHDVLYLALTRLQEDYEKACEAGAALEASQNAIDAHVLVASMEQDAEDEDDGDADPDADLDDGEEDGDE